MASRTAALCARLENWLGDHLPEVLTDLRPGLSEAELNVFETELGQVVPADFRALYQWHDGQHGETTGPFHGLTFLPLAEVLSHHRSWLEIEPETQEIIEEDGNFRSVPPSHVQQKYCCRGWIPFAYDHGGNYLGIDLAPGQAGMVGQVINFGRDEHTHFVLGNTLTDYLAWLVSALENGNFKISEEEGERSLNTLRPHNEHFLDGLSVLFGP